MDMNMKYVVILLSMLSLNAYAKHSHMGLYLTNETGKVIYWNDVSASDCVNAANKPDNNRKLMDSTNGASGKESKSSNDNTYWVCWSEESVDRVTTVHIWGKHNQDTSSCHYSTDERANYFTNYSLDNNDPSCNFHATLN